MIDDLKDYRPLGAFQFFDGDTCVLILCALIFACLILPEILG